MDLMTRLYVCSLKSFTVSQLAYERRKHSHKKRKDNLEGSLDRVLFAPELDFPKILVPRLPQNSSNVNTERAGKSKQLYSLCDQLLGAMQDTLYSFTLEEKHCCSYYSRLGDS